MENQSRKRGSRTAEITALIRANHLLNNPKPWIIEDPYAIHFLSRRWRKALQPGPWQWLLYHFSFKKMAAVASHVLYRARISEQYALKAVAKGARQVVILGAGYDTFALRHPNLPAQIFEVDLPTTGAIKQQRMKAAKIPHPCHLHLVAVDFERDDLGERLIAAGFDPQSPCFLTWMGVTYYLARTAIAKTLSKLDSLTAPGSELLLDYMTPPELIPPAEWPAINRMLKFVQKSGEPMISFFEPSSLQGELNLPEHWTQLDEYLPAEESRKFLGQRTDLPVASSCFRLPHYLKT